jgi:starch synthase (maltosyl-transferring)
MIIYNLFPLLAGPFTRWGPHLQRAASLGFNWVFLNPIQEPGSSGSLYAIKNYFALNPRLIDRASSLSPEAQLRAAIDQARGLGLNMMVDLVVNHCAADSELLEQHPEWFLWEAPGRVVHPGCLDQGKKVVWKDLALFDHRHSRDRQGLFRYFRSVIDHLLELGFRGFRCDAAYQVPAELWQRLIGDTKAREPQALFLAETLGCPPEQTVKTAEAGFDYIFNSSKWWDFEAPWLLDQHRLTREVVPSISFPESHDTVRLFEELRGNLAGMKQRYLFAALFSGGVLMPVGFELGFRKRLHVVRTRPEDWEPPHADLEEFIRRVNALKAAHPIFQQDAATELLPSGNKSVLLMRKVSGHAGQEALIVLNKDLHARRRFRREDLRRSSRSLSATLRDLSPEEGSGSRASSLEYDLRPGQGLVFLTTRSPELELPPG